MAGEQPLGALEHRWAARCCCHTLLNGLAEILDLFKALADRDHLRVALLLRARVAGQWQVALATVGELIARVAFEVRVAE